jgi:hypothetical protein
MVRYTHRGGTYYSIDRITGDRESLHTKDKTEAQELMTAKNESARESAFNLQKARIYMSVSDPEVASRTWSDAIAGAIDSKPEDSENRLRWERAGKDKALDRIEGKVLLETRAEDLLAVMKAGTVSTNVFLRRLHNFCIGMNWLPWPILPKKLWPKVKYKSKRAITFGEHCRIVARKNNEELRGVGNPWCDTPLVSLRLGGAGPQGRLTARSSPDGSSKRWVLRPSASGTAATTASPVESSRGNERQPV